MSAISELRKKAESKFPGYPVEFEDGSKIMLKSSANFTEQERAEFNDRITAVKDMEKDDKATLQDLHSKFVDALASVADDADKAREEFAKESTALLTVVFEEYGTHLQAQDAEEAPKSGRATRSTRTR